MVSIKTLILLVVTGIQGGSSSQFLNCNWVNSLNCVTYTPGVVCGNSGISYANRCYLAKAECLDKTLFQANDGPCHTAGAVTTITSRQTTVASTTQPSTTTTIPSTVQPTSDPLQMICDTMSKVHCVNDIEPICGSNGRTYINACEFHIEVCKQHDLTIKHIGFC